MELSENLRLVARQTVLDEINFRMGKLWRIFSWTSTVLVAIIGGTVALRTADHHLGLGHQIIVIAAAIVLAAYAWFWLRQNLQLERQARDALAAHDQALGIASYNEAVGGALPRPDQTRPGARFVIGYNATVILLAAAAIAAAVVPLG